MKRLLPVMIVLLFIALSVGSALSESLTFDEIVHAKEGIHALTGHTFLIDTNNPPLVREIAMLPIVLWGRISSPIAAIQLFPARFVVILLGVALLVAVYLTTKKYFGKTQALVALFLLALEPTFLSNSHYITLDTGLTLFFFISYIAFLRLMEKYSLRNLIVSGAVMGLSASSKILTLPFYLVSTVVVGFGVFNGKIRKIVLSIPRLLIFLASTALVIWATYFYTTDVIIAQREDAGRLSSRLQTYATAHHNMPLASGITFLETQKVPLGNYLAVLKNTLIRSQQKQTTFFFGSFYPESKWYFMPVTVFYKEPLALWLLFGLGMFAGMAGNVKKRSTLVFAVPFFTIIAILSFSTIQPWVRYAEPAMPFLVIIASQSITLLYTRSQKLLFLLFCLWYVFSVSRSFPHYISYANELAGPSNIRFTKFMDSNLDWGQSIPDLVRFTRQIKPSQVRFSYFGQDNGDPYGLASPTPYGGNKIENICAFHDITLPNQGSAAVFISVSNWYYCGYYRDPGYALGRVKSVVGDSVLVFAEN